MSIHPQADVKPGEVILEARGITKRYPNNVIALDKVNFELKAGEVHAILGENGAGKTTLMNILFGVIQPDEGEIYLYSKKVRFKSPIDAISMGIGMVHQTRKLVPAHTVLENIILGHPKTGKFLNLRKVREEVEEMCKLYGFKIDLDARVWQLSAGEQEMVEILRALYRGARILILDEPTSVLTPPEVEMLLNSIRHMTKNNIAIVPFITHKLPEVFEVSDKVTVLRRGKVVKTLSIHEASMKTLAEYMVGREVMFNLTKSAVNPGREILKVENISALNDKGVVALNNVSFSVREGEIFGIVGVSGNGQEELAEVLAGLRKPISGKIIFDSRDITHATVLERLKLGIGYIPPDRLGAGAIGHFSLVDNILLNLYYDKEFKKGIFLNYPKVKEYAQRLISEFDVVTPGVDAKAAHLSGGNLQKVILARVIPKTTKLLIANLPTSGLDVASAESVRNRLLNCREKGMAVILISEDLDEALQLSDRVAPIYEGKILTILDADKVKKEEIGAMMAGVAR